MVLTYNNKYDLYVNQKKKEKLIIILNNSI